ncbi:MAG: ribonuclease Z [Oscillospiraceae bacterium]|nr:ribonuclease Z [Oscillospiraceae bacterium]
MVDVCLAGTGGMMPLKNRWLTCCFMEYNGKAMLIDCGEGTQIALSDAGCKLSRLETLFITHFHADHISGLPGLLLSLGNYSKVTPLHIYGPKGITGIVKKLCCICAVLPYELIITELDSKNPTTFRIPEIDSMIDVKSFPVDHSVECIGYSFVFSRKPIFNPEKASALGIPKQMWSVLHSGQSIELEGNTITTEMVTDGERKSVKITYATDSRPTYDITDNAFRSDLFICEGMYFDDEYSDSMKKKGHMLIPEALQIAKDAQVQRLWLTHYSPAMMNPHQYAIQASRIFDGVVISDDGQKISL